MSVQSELKKFNDKIKVDFDTKKTLIEKREILLKKLDKLKERDIPDFEKFNQGSYAIFTGIEPDDDDEYDIDVALIFYANKKDHKPIKFKKEIYKILESHTYYGAEIKKPCVTVTYKKNKKAEFHVDLVTYLYENKEDTNSQLYIAKGKDEDSQKWEKADPKGLVNYINDGIEKGDKREQFRRIVRYLKKWKNKNFSNTGNVKPPSIGITLLSIDNFKYFEDDDLSSLINVVNKIIDEFKSIDSVDKNKEKSKEKMYRIKLSMPSSLNFEENDIFEKMSDRQMTDFKNKIEKFRNDLKSVANECDEQEQYKKLNKIFGDDFEIPNIENSFKKQFNFIPSSSESGMN